MAETFSLFYVLTFILKQSFVFKSRASLGQWKDKKNTKI